ncbi:MAG: DNA-processing protein DprA [Candidatus Azotimanducaceae bacterium WSBS_2022_MAG_OTU7]
MKITNNALNVLTAKTYRGIGRAWIVKHHKGNETTTELVAMLNRSTKEDRQITLVDFERVRRKIRESIMKLAGSSDGVVAIGDEDFPQYRGDVKNSDRPVVMFYRGDLRLLRRINQNITVIGLLIPDQYTEIAENEVVSKLVSRGATIVSGLALGCDSVAHRQAILSKGKTVAILPSPLNEIQPSKNRDLAEQIVKSGGLLVTEYLEKAKSKLELSGRYQERDRLQALFSDCVILAASYAKNDLGLDSGSRLAMDYAAKYSIPRAVMYEAGRDGGNPKYDLNRQLIRNQDGIVVIDSENVDSALSEIMCYQSPQPIEAIGQADLFG